MVIPSAPLATWSELFARSYVPERSVRGLVWSVVEGFKADR